MLVVLESPPAVHQVVCPAFSLQMFEHAHQQTHNPAVLEQSNKNGEKYFVATYSSPHIPRSVNSSLPPAVVASCIPLQPDPICPS